MFRSLLLLVSGIIPVVLSFEEPSGKKPDLWGCDSTVLIREQYGDEANGVLEFPQRPLGGIYDNMTCITKIQSPNHTQILFSLQSLRLAKLDRRNKRRCKHGAALPPPLFLSVFYDPPNPRSRVFFCRELPAPIVSRGNKLVALYKLHRFALNPMEFKAYFTVIYVAQVQKRLTFNVSPLLEAHGTISELPALHQQNSSVRWNLKLKKYVNCTLHIIPPCNGRDVLRIGYEHPLETGSMLFVEVPCDEENAPYAERSLVQKRVPNHQLMYVDVEINSEHGDQYSVSWECTRVRTAPKTIQMIAGLPPRQPDGSPVVEEPLAPLRPLVVSGRFHEIQRLENDFLQ